MCLLQYFTNAPAGEVTSYGLTAAHITVTSYYPELHIMRNLRLHEDFVC